MNKLEEFVYHKVKNNPALKQFIRNAYQGCYDIFPRPKDYFSSNVDYREGYYFGFHDVSPLNGDDTKCLAHKLAVDLRMPKANEGEGIGYFDIENGKLGDFHKLDDTYAWNYHKGCRLQWLDKNRIIFNTAIGGKICSKSINIITKTEKIYDWPIDAINSNGTLATAFSYERLERCMPGYGYPYSDDSYLDKDISEETGLYIVDLINNTRKLVVPLTELAPLAGEKYTRGYLHFVTHTEFSKDNRYIAFLYRCIPRDDDYMKRHTMMVVYDIKEDRLILLPTQESGSHYVWNNRNQLVASVVLNGKSCHAIFDVNNLDNVQIIAGEKLNSDGHQSFVTDDLFVTDTYPDSRRMAKIYMVDTNEHKVTPIVKVYSPKKFQTKDFKCHIACDLHPRVSTSGHYICFDSPRTGKRGIYIMKI